MPDSLRLLGRRSWNEEPLKLQGLCKNFRLLEANIKKAVDEAERVKDGWRVEAYYFPKAAQGTHKFAGIRISQNGTRIYVETCEDLQALSGLTGVVQKSAMVEIAGLAQCLWVDERKPRVYAGIALL